MQKGFYCVRSLGKRGPGGAGLSGLAPLTPGTGLLLISALSKRELSPLQGYQIGSEPLSLSLSSPDLLIPFHAAGPAPTVIWGRARPRRTRGCKAQRKSAAFSTAKRLWDTYLFLKQPTAEAAGPEDFTRSRGMTPRSSNPAGQSGDPTEIHSPLAGGGKHGAEKTPKSVLTSQTAAPTQP